MACNDTLDIFPSLGHSAGYHKCHALKRFFPFPRTLKIGIRYLKAYRAQNVKSLNIIRITEEVRYRGRDFFSHLSDFHKPLRGDVIKKVEFLEIFCKYFGSILANVQYSEGKEESCKSGMLAFLDCIDEILGRLFCESRELQKVLFFKSVYINKMTYKPFYIKQFNVLFTEPLNIHGTP